MPFTFSHPAIVLPLGKPKFKLSLTGLVMGSIAPDLEYYLSLKATASYIGHSLPGFFWFDIPVALITCFVFHNIIRNVLVPCLPMWYRCRLHPLLSFNWNRYVKEHKLALLLSVIIGILSHFLWDAFTHQEGAVIMLIPFLSKQINLFHQPVHIYSMMQFLFSVVGLWVINRHIASLPTQEQMARSGANCFRYWSSVAWAAACILIIRIIALPQYLTFWDLFMASIGSQLYAIVIVSLFAGKRKFVSGRVKLLL